MVGEAIRRASPETAEFLLEIAANASTATQALRDHNQKLQQIAQSAAPFGVQRNDIQTISCNVHSLYSPLLPGLPGFPGMPQIGPGNVSPFGGGLGQMQPGGAPFGGLGQMQTGGAGFAPGLGQLQPDVQFGSYQAKSVLRVNVRDTARVGEVVDALTRAGGTLAGSFSFRVADDAAARRSALEAAGRDARAKAEMLAQAAGKQVGDPVTITEEVVATNGVYSALRAAMPFAFGAGTPQVAGELEYYARVSASFKLQ